jgi:ubiquinone/menaquinone biosynthesis C-methylase UbiE
MPKDNFSTASSQYAQYRPGYPPELFRYLSELVKHKEKAWDCGTGNGQLAIGLSAIFNKVYATDISQSQLDNAQQAPNIFYSLQPAEKVDFPNHYFDLVTVAQAIHWFDFDKFYSEVRRTTKKEGLLAVIGYGGISVSAEIDAIKKDFYKNVVGPYWDKERKYIDDDYKTIPFPFEEIKTPSFENKFSWTKEQFLGYINTWSAVKHYISKNGSNPVDDLALPVTEAWGGKKFLDVRFPVILRIGKISN